jgi:hypothetical protein
LSLKYSVHARFQQKERSITDSEVAECLAAWNTCYTDKKGNFIYKAIVNGKGIKVVVAKDNKEFIITVADY